MASLSNLLPTLVQPLLGILVFLAIAWLLSEDRRAVSPRLVLAGLGLQVLLAVLLLKAPGAQQLFLALNRVVVAIQDATREGTGLVFGYLGGGRAPFEVTDPGSAFVLAFQALPLILVIGALSAVLFYWRILPVVVQGFAWVLGRTLGTGGPLGLAAAANVFVGMTEAPLLIRPYLKALSRSALFGVMAVGMATVAGTVMILYAGILGGAIPNALGHILTASLVNAPAALVIAGILVPERGPVDTHSAHVPSQARGVMDAITRGTLDAIPLWLNIMAMLVVMIALVGLANQLLGLLPAVGGEALTAQRVLGWIMAPAVWLIGIPWSEASVAGSLMGIKTVLNELVAYLQLAALPNGALSERSALIMTYALCGFANFGSLGIMIGGLGAMAPERRDEIVGLGLKSILAGTLATLMTGAVVATMVQP